ncbi:MAG: SOS response-associated peptidase [Candidatus Delongbacteria bacterium]
MCGRYAFSRVDKHLLERLALEQDELPEGLEPRWNLAPGQSAAALRLLAGKRRLERLHWGVKHPARPIGLLINARAETAARLPAFRLAFAAASEEAGRCLVPCEGWYEWQREGRIRRPWFIRPAAGEVALMAGLWWEARQGSGRAFTILTCVASAPISHIHERMPVVMAEADWASWLGGLGGESEWRDRLLPWPAEHLECWEVGPEVNGIASDHPGLIEPATAVQGSLFP